MNSSLQIAVLFAAGSMGGWVLEVFYRHWFSKQNPEHRWLNPGFLTGPCLPLYGSGLCILYMLCALAETIPFPAPWVGFAAEAVAVALSMTLLELLVGSYCIHFCSLRLWDYRNVRFNYKGIICLRFSIYWTLLGMAYAMLFHDRITAALAAMEKTDALLFGLGAFFGIFAVDLGYSSGTVNKIHRFAQKHRVVVQFEGLKIALRGYDTRFPAAHFWVPFHSERVILRHLKEASEQLGQLAERYESPLDMLRADSEQLLASLEEARQRFLSEWDRSRRKAEKEFKKATSDLQEEIRTNTARIYQELVESGIRLQQDLQESSLKLQFDIQNTLTNRQEDCLLLLFFPVYVLIYVLTSRFNLISDYHVIHSVLDDMIPFCEVFVLPYIAWMVLLPGMACYLLLRDRHALHRMMRYLVLTTCITLPIFILFPTCQHLRPAEFDRSNLFIGLVKVIYFFDASTNVCPSMHCVWAFAIYFGIRYSKCLQSKTAKVLWLVQALLICASTVLIKQHSIIDVAAAVPFIFIGWLVCFCRKMPWAEK